MSYNGSGTFQINTTGQPVVTGTVISATTFNSLTADLATGLSTAITKDGQTTTTARIPFAAGITSTLATDATSTASGSIITAGGVGVAKALWVGTTANVGSTTDSSSVSTGSIITAGGVGIAKNLYVGVNANIAGTLSVTGSTTLTNPVINNIKMGYSTTATAAGTTTLTVSSNYRQFFTGSTTQTVVLPVTSTLVTGIAYEIENNSTGTLTVNSSGGNLVGTIPAGVCAHAVCIGTTLTTAADWDWDYISTSTITGTGANVLGTSPTITTPTISSLSSAAATALTLQSAGTTAITVNTSQNVGIGTTNPTAKQQITSTSAGAATVGLFLNNVSDTTSTEIRLAFAASSNDDIASNRYSYISLLNTAGNNSGTLVFATNASGASATEKARIESSGNLLVGTTSNTRTAKFRVYKSGDNVMETETDNTGPGYIHIGFVNPNGRVGNISTSASTTSYVTSSDYRLKENVTPMTGALAKVSLLKPCTYKWKVDGSDGQGFIAHELAEVVPQCVTGEKDAVNEDGSIKPQGIDTSFLVATLTAAIQEQQAIITSLTDRITALESK